MLESYISLVQVNPFIGLIFTAAVYYAWDTMWKAIGGHYKPKCQCNCQEDGDAAS
jgi:hypothetical protein